MHVVSCVTGKAKAYVGLVAAQIFKMIFLQNTGQHY